MVRIARIVTDLGPASNGQFGARKVRLIFHNTVHEIPAYAKRLSDEALLAEVMAAVLGRELSLPIPEPVFAFSLAGDEVLFASLDANYPDFTHFLNLPGGQWVNTKENTALLHKLSQCAAINAAISFDEWIVNHDRNLGNILYDGEDQFMLIDHNLALNLSLSVESPIMRNELLSIWLAFNQDDEHAKQQFKRRMAANIEQIDDSLAIGIGQRLIEQYASLNQALINDIVQFLTHRLRYLVPIMHTTIPTKQLSL